GGVHDARKGNRALLQRLRTGDDRPRRPAPLGQAIFHYLLADPCPLSQRRTLLGPARAARSAGPLRQRFSRSRPATAKSARGCVNRGLSSLGIERSALERAATDSALESHHRTLVVLRPGGWHGHEKGGHPPGG